MYRLQPLWVVGTIFSGGLPGLRRKSEIRTPAITHFTRGYRRGHENFRRSTERCDLSAVPCEASYRPERVAPEGASQNISCRNHPGNRRSIRRRCRSFLRYLTSEQPCHSRVPRRLSPLCQRCRWRGSRVARLSGGSWVARCRWLSRWKLDHPSGSQEQAQSVMLRWKPSNPRET